MAVAYKTHEEEATGTQRVIHQCRSCKSRWASDYMVIPGALGNRFLRHDENNTRVWIENERCPECGSQVLKSNEVVGVVTDHICDAKCRNAKTAKCEYSCGGLHHAEGLFRK